MLEVVAAAIDVDEHARERGGQHGGPVLVQVGVEIAREGIGEAVGEGLEPRLAVVVAGDVGQGLRAVVRHAHQHRRARLRRGVPDDGERKLHRAHRATNAIRPKRATALARVSLVSIDSATAPGFGAVSP